MLQDVGFYVRYLRKCAGRKPGVITRQYPRQSAVRYNAMTTFVCVGSAMMVFLSRATAVTRTTASAATACPADNHYCTKPWTLHAYHPTQHHQRRAIKLPDEGPASPLQGLASPPSPPPNNAPPPPSPMHVNRLFKTDPLVLAWS